MFDREMIMGRITQLTQLFSSEPKSNIVNIQLDEYMKLNIELSTELDQARKKIVNLKLDIKKLRQVEKTLRAEIY